MGTEKNPGTAKDSKKSPVPASTSTSTSTSTQSGRVVVSSLTGRPMTLPETPSGAVPDRSPSDRGSGSNDERLLGDVPPHW